MNRVWNLVENRFQFPATGSRELNPQDKELERERNAAIKKVTGDMDEGFKFNTAISGIMILVNAIEKYGSAHSDENKPNAHVLNEAIKTVVLLLAPIVPHLCEEMWQTISPKDKTIARAAWPVYNEGALKLDVVQIVVQVNGKLRGRVNVESDASESRLKEIVLADEKIQSLIQQHPIQKFIVVPNRLVNIVLG